MIVLVSGGFDPLHVGHLRMIEAARAHGRVVVALNSDEWLYRKKGYFFMPLPERMEIIMGLGAVSLCLAFDDSDGTACDAINRIRPHYFANGGDRITANAAESALCEKLGIGQLFEIGGGKAQSSSKLVQTLMQRLHP